MSLKWQMGKCCGCDPNERGNRLDCNSNINPTYSNNINPYACEIILVGEKDRTSSTNANENIVSFDMLYVSNNIATAYKPMSGYDYGYNDECYLSYNKGNWKKCYARTNTNDNYLSVALNQRYATNLGYYYYMTYDRTQSIKNNKPIYMHNNSTWSSNPSYYRGDFQSHIKRATGFSPDQNGYSQYYIVGINGKIDAGTPRLHKEIYDYSITPTFKKEYVIGSYNKVKDDEIYVDIIPAPSQYAENNIKGWTSCGTLYSETLRFKYSYTEKVHVIPENAICIGFRYPKFGPVYNDQWPLVKFNYPAPRIEASIYSKKSRNDNMFYTVQTGLTAITIVHPITVRTCKLHVETIRVPKQNPPDEQPSNEEENPQTTNQENPNSGQTQNNTNNSSNTPSSDTEYETQKVVSILPGSSGRINLTYKIREISNDDFTIDLEDYMDVVILPHGSETINANYWPTRTTRFHYDPLLGQITLTSELDYTRYYTPLIRTLRDRTVFTYGGSWSDVAISSVDVPNGFTKTVYQKHKEQIDACTINATAFGSSSNRFGYIATPVTIQVTPNYTIQYESEEDVQNATEQETQTNQQTTPTNEGNSEQPTTTNDPNSEQPATNNSTPPSEETFKPPKTVQYEGRTYHLLSENSAEYEDYLYYLISEPQQSTHTQVVSYDKVFSDGKLYDSDDRKRLLPELNQILNTKYQFMKGGLFTTQEEALSGLNVNFVVNVVFNDYVRNSGNGDYVVPFASYPPSESE